MCTENFIVTLNPRIQAKEFSVKLCSMGHLIFWEYSSAHSVQEYINDRSGKRTARFTEKTVAKWDVMSTELGDDIGDERKVT